ncbi:gp53-like domain-containing protein [Citrobacter braakii]|uniref:gp53-like domain-containing protein n=1 Tax=Citrobacter braakii TaxID=57706 RepID=UPI001C7D36F4|nr:phage tail protein [Citrobacter braakii]
MNRTDAPAKQPKPFAINGQREDILPTTPAGDNTASYESGFPPITMTLKSAGGLPPKGQDMNQILFELSALARWSSAGALNTYDSSFAAAIGGYPSGAFVLGDDLKTVYRCTSNGNTANPNSITTGWAKVAQDIADILSLGTAAYKAVGVGTNQLPDMSSFTSNNATSGWQKLPSGIILQWGFADNTPSATSSATYPIPFPNEVFHVITCGYQVAGNQQAYVTLNSTSLLTSFAWNAFYALGGSVPTLSSVAGQVRCRYIAIGR